jgi:lipoprotein-anchoring transpeptidase ErfK/SrfK
MRLTGDLPERQRSRTMLTRRHFVMTTASLFSAPIAASLPGAAAASVEEEWAYWDALVTPRNYDPARSNPWGLEPRLLPRLVEARGNLRPGDIHVDAVARYLYHVRGDGTAMRYGVAIAEGDLYMTGRYTIRRKAKWPGWTPTPNMIRREPEVYGPYRGGMPGGPENPLGARALYLYRGGRDSYLRIHGTPSESGIGGRASSGCVRMTMAHVIDLYEEVRVGSRAILHPPEEQLGARS